MKIKLPELKPPSLSAKKRQMLKVSLTFIANGVYGNAMADLSAAGPINSDTGYPYWYRDSTGLSLEPCLNESATNVDAPANSLCMLAHDQLPNPDLPAAFPDNFWQETFWTNLDSSLATNTGSAHLKLALAGGLSAAGTGDNISFGRIQISIDNPVADATLKVTHPFGEVTFQNVPKGQGAIDVAETININQINFTGAIPSNVGPFLRWSDQDGKPLPIYDQFGDEYLGDPNIPHAITGSPHKTNFFRVEGPVGLGTSNLCSDPKLGDDENDLTDCIETDLFAVLGKIAADGDKDLIPDVTDNCPTVRNTNQRDTDTDGFGNVCDTDLNNDNITNILDVQIFKSVYLCQTNTNPEIDFCDHADFNGDGVVNNLDAGTLKKYFRKPPG